MKFFVIFLSIYTFYLVSAPCVDDVFHGNRMTQGQTSSQGQGSHSDHGDACSPFCICSCCSVPVTVTPVIFVSQPFSSIQQTIFPEPFTFSSSFSVSFWQPPKLS